MLLNPKSMSYLAILQTVNDQPEGEGWFVKIKVADPKEVDALMDRAAYEALRDQRKRLEAKLLRTNDAALSRLKLHYMAPSRPVSGRASKATVTALLIEGIDLACAKVGIMSAS